METALSEEIAEKLCAFSGLSCSKSQALFVMWSSCCVLQALTPTKASKPQSHSVNEENTRSHMWSWHDQRVKNPLLHMHPVIKVNNCDLVALEEKGAPLWQVNHPRCKFYSFIIWLPMRQSTDKCCWQNQVTSCSPSSLTRWALISLAIPRCSSGHRVVHQSHIFSWTYDTMKLTSADYHHYPLHPLSEIAIPASFFLMVRQQLLSHICLYDFLSHSLHYHCCSWFQLWP